MSRILSNEGKIIESCRKIRFTDGSTLIIYDITEIRIGTTSLRIKGWVSRYFKEELKYVIRYFIIYPKDVKYMEITPTEHFVKLD
jgi:hypothetical protein